MTIRKYSINEYQVGLLFRKGVLRQVLEPGTYWIFNEEVLIYDLTYPFVPPVDWNIVLKNEHLMARLQIAEVKEGELLLVFADGKLLSVETTGKYAYWKSFRDYQLIKVDITGIEIGPSLPVSLLIKDPLKSFVRTVTVEPYEKALLLVDGKFIRLLEPGEYYFWKNPTSVQVARVDTRNRQREVSGQEMLTKDKASLRINAVIHYQVVDPVKAVMDNKEYENLLYAAAQLALRSLVSTLSLDELLEKKEALGKIMIGWMGDVAPGLGIEIRDAGIKDIILPADMKSIMNQVLMAEKRAQANIITRREETASTRSLLNTAKLMEENAMLWKLKEMEFVEKVSEKISQLTVSGSGSLADQLKQLFVTQKT